MEHKVRAKGKSWRRSGYIESEIEGPGQGAQVGLNMSCVR
jgi:hypothetical protein